MHTFSEILKCSNFLNLKLHVHVIPKSSVDLEIVI
jgi:hypothetical protein